MRAKEIMIMVMASQLAYGFSLVGHRGYSAYAPENTLQSIMAAYQHGAMAECDIQLTKDGKLILMHDDTLTRTAGLNRFVSDMTYDELLLLDVGSWKGPQWRGTKIPLLTEVIEQIPSEGLLFVELKSGDFNEGVSDAMALAIHNLIAQVPAQTLAKLVFISFDHLFLSRFKNDFDVKTLLLLTHLDYPGSWPQVKNAGDFERYSELARQDKHDGLFIEYGEYLSRAMISSIKDNGLLVAVWNYSPDDTIDNLNKMKEFGVDFWNTDDVEKMSRYSAAPAK